MLNPYKQLEDVFSYYAQTPQAAEKLLEISDEMEKSVNNGGAALWAYGLLQFCQQAPEKKRAFIQALLRYCELDTLAMVFIWEFFNEMTHK